MEMDEAVTNAIALAPQFMQHVANPTKLIYQKLSIERDRAAGNEWVIKDYFDANTPRPTICRRRKFTNKYGRKNSECQLHS